jgi:hypothetical protein
MGPCPDLPRWSLGPGLASCKNASAPTRNRCCRPSCSTWGQWGRTGDLSQHHSTLPTSAPALRGHDRQSKRGQEGAWSAYNLSSTTAGRIGQLVIGNDRIGQRRMGVGDRGTTTRQGQSGTFRCTWWRGGGRRRGGGATWTRNGSQFPGGARRHTPAHLGPPEVPHGVQVTEPVQVVHVELRGVREEVAQYLGDQHLHTTCRQV